MAKKRRNKRTAKKTQKNAGGKLLSLLIFLLALVIALFVSKIVYDSVMTSVYPKKYTEYVEKYAAEYAIDETFLYAVIKTESGFDPDAVSSANARGLTQITEDTFDWLKTKTGENYTFDDLFTPEISIKYGAFFLSILMEEYGDRQTAAAAYHAGMSRVSSWLNDAQYSDDGVHLKNIPISDTAHYVNKIAKAYSIYTNIYDKK